MKLKLLSALLLFAGIVFFSSCEREISFENGGVPILGDTGTIGGTAIFSLSGGSGSCPGAVTNGTYTAGVPLSASNSVTIEVDVDSIGTYTISTSTVNGVSFSVADSFTTTGVQNITLTGNGTPLAAGSFNLTIGASGCIFSIVVVNGGSSGGAAVYSFSGGTGSCTGAAATGTYTAGTAVSAANTAVLNVMVDSLGTYNITTAPVNGISFSSFGTFTTTGAQTITFLASGTPTTAGDFNFTPGSTGCTFTITVAGSSNPLPSNYLRCKIDGVEKTFYFEVTANEGPNNVDMFGRKLLDPTTGESLGFDIINADGAIVTGTYSDTGTIKSCIPVYYADLTDQTELYSSGAVSSFPEIFNLIVTSNTATRIEGTFSGTFYKSNWTTPVKKIVTDGTFGIDK